MASQVFNHSEVRVFPNPIPIDGYLGRAYATRAAAGRNVLGNNYSNRAVANRWGIGKSQSNHAVTEFARPPQAMIEPQKADSDKKEGSSERVHYIRLMIITEAISALSIYGIWELWHLIH